MKHATQLVRLAAERLKPDAERDPDYMERELGQLRARMERDQKSYFEKADEALMVSFVKQALNLRGAQRIAIIESMFRGGDVEQRVEALYRAGKVTKLDERMRMFEETSDQLRERHDPLLDLALSLDPELKDWNEATRRRDGAIARIRPLWRRAVIAHAGSPVAPDANSTLRVSFAHVRGYSPRDGVLYTPQTTLSGMLEKYTGEEPFDLPEAVLQAAQADKTGRWKDKNLSDVPLCFLADADTTGGNSGSPAVNGRGELVGLNFDRVWENVANDFGYNPDIARNVNVDIRFMLWLLDQVQDAEQLLKELGIHR